MSKKIETIDTAVVYLLVKKLITPITQTQAYKLGLINNTGVIIRVPTTDKEHDALTILDRFMLLLKRLLGSKIIQLNNFLYMQTSNNTVYKQLTASGSMERRAEIIRISKDITRLTEKYGCDKEYLVQSLLNEDIKNGEIEDV